MKQIKLLLAPQPGAAPEFLDDIALVNPSPAVLQFWTEHLSESQIVLEGYTRDSWAWKPGDVWTTFTVTSATGRKKLPGFLGYLKQRQKSCYGRFAPRGLFVISYTQSHKNTEDQKMDCRVAIDMSQVPKCNLKPLAKLVKPVKPAAAKQPAIKGGGFLGKLVGAQQRTNHHIAVATAKKPPAVAAAKNGDSTGAAAAVTERRTAQQVLADFRQSMQDKMLDFDLSSEEVLKVSLSVPEHTAGLSTEEKTRVTMEILKYMVYEAAEEVNEEWVAHKEASEFVDEVTVAVYKEGAAPPEVLEELNKGELPDEVRGQQRAIQEQMHRQVNQAESRNHQEVQRDAHRFEEDEGDEDFAVLNTNKRDRRTAEDYEKEKAKRARSS
jgi:hypothetical protein